MRAYYTEGFIKEVKISEEDGKCQILFKLESTAPYMFEKKTDGGDTKRCLLFVDNVMCPCDVKIVRPDYGLVVSKVGVLNSLLVARANRLKVGVQAEEIPNEVLQWDKEAKDNVLIKVRAITVL